MTHDLAGAWRLVSWAFEYEDGRPSEFPLGREARGLLLYTPGGPKGGWVSATLMAAESPASLAYAGRYEVCDGTVYHSIEVASDASLVGMTTTRHIGREDDVLTLAGPDFRSGTGRSQKIVWRRAP